MENGKKNVIDQAGQQSQSNGGSAGGGGGGSSFSQTTLDNICVELQEGELLAVIGPVGAGKVRRFFSFVFFFFFAFFLFFLRLLLRRRTSFISFSLHYFHFENGFFACPTVLGVGNYYYCLICGFFFFLFLFFSFISFFCEGERRKKKFSTQRQSLSLFYFVVLFAVRN